MRHDAGYDGAPLPMANPALILVSRLKIEGFIVRASTWKFGPAPLSLHAGGHRQAAPARECGRVALPLHLRRFLGLLGARTSQAGRETGLTTCVEPCAATVALDLQALR